MSLGKMLLEQLKAFGAGTARPEGVDAVLNVGEGAQQASVVFADSDRYSVTLRRLAVGTARTADEDAQTFLSAKAAAIARQLSYLEEPLALWELDNRDQIAQLRSSPPHHEGDELSYWEVELHAGEQGFATLTRYRWTPALPEREAVDYPATFTLVARLTDSLEAALAE